LLKAHATRRIHPHGHLGQVLANIGIFRNQFEFVGLQAIQGLFAREGYVPLVGEFLPAGSEAEQQITAELVVFVSRDLVGKLFEEPEDTFRVGVDFGNWLTVLLANVSGHLKIRSATRVVDASFLRSLIGNRIGLVGVDLKICGCGAEVCGGGIEFAQHGLQILGRSRSA